MERSYTGHSVTAGQRFPEPRRSPRYPISAQAETVEPLSGRRVGGRITVISLSGCYIRTEDTLDAGTVAQLRVEWREAIFETWARVVHAIPGDGMGIAFFDTKPQQSELLNKWIEAIAGVVTP